MPQLIANRPVLRMTSELGRVMAAAKAREQAGHPVIHLERGEPDFDTPAHIVEALSAAARAGETHYPDARGSLPLRQALVEKLARENGIGCEPDDVVITLGGTHALQDGVAEQIGDVVSSVEDYFRIGDGRDGAFLQPGRTPQCKSSFKYVEKSQAPIRTGLSETPGRRMSAAAATPVCGKIHRSSPM